MDTRTRILLAAEKLYAERGIDAASLRDIVVEAGQRNTSAIQYHFGAGTDLVEEIFRFRMSQVNAERLEVLARMHADGREADIGSLVDALIFPLVAFAQRPDSYYVRFLAQLSAHPTYRISDNWQMTQSLRLVREGLQRALSWLPPDIFAERWRMVSHLAIHTVADHESEVRPTTGEPERTPAWAQRLSGALVALLTSDRPVASPPSGETKSNTSSIGYPTTSRTGAGSGGRGQT